MSENERRRGTRRNMTLPVRVQGVQADGQAWSEMTVTVDASEGGLAVLLDRPLQVGHVLQLLLPMPRNFRRYDLAQGSYRTWALVRGVRPDGKGRTRVSLRLLGRHPPRGYEEQPGGLFLTKGDAPPVEERPERRAEARHPIFLNLRVRRVEVEGQELTVAEDASRHGLRVMTSLPVARGEHVTVEDPAGGFECRAEIRSVRIGKDGVPRLHLRLIEGEIPSQVVPD